MSHQHKCGATPLSPSASSVTIPATQERRAAELLALFDLPLPGALWYFLTHNSTLPVDSTVHLLDPQTEPQHIERLLALLALVQRTTINQVSQQRMTCPADILRHISELLLLVIEEFWVLLLKKKNEVQARLPLYRRAVDSAVMRVAEIYRPAILRNCPSLIVCHNHPSGDPTLSPEDIEVTHQLREAGNLLEVELIDQLIAGSAFPFRIISLREQVRW